MAFGGAHNCAFSIGEPGTSIGVGVGERVAILVVGIATEVVEPFDEIPSK